MSQSIKLCVSTNSVSDGQSSKFTCITCGKYFFSKFTLNRHIKKSHPNKFEKISCSTNFIKKGKLSKLKCITCGKYFSSKFTLKRHIKKYHANELNVDKKCYKCDTCNSEFNYEKYLKQHMRNEHMSQTFSKSHYKCPICQQQFLKNDVLDHFENNHDVIIRKTIQQFKSLEEFWSWKLETEKKTKSKYIANGDKGKIKYFKCSRSGNFVTESTGERHIKILGSKKINAYCPASIKVTESKNGMYIVSYQATHVGHENDLGHLSLTDAEKSNLASKIAANIPFDSILDEIRISITNNEQERLHLLTKKDLYNIQKSFNLMSEEKHENDCISLDYKSPTKMVIDTDIESSTIINELSRTTTTESHTLEEFKQSLLNDYSNLIKSLKNKEQCRAMQKNLKSLVPGLNAINSIDNTHSFQRPPNKSHPANKKIVPQRMFQTKKKKKVTHIFQQTTDQDIQNTAISLLINHKQEMQ